MLIQGSRTARDLVNVAGRPLAVATFAAMNIFLAPSVVWAEPTSNALGTVLAQMTGQPAKPAAADKAAADKPAADKTAPAKPRDPTKPDKGEKSEPKVNVSEHMTVDLHVKDEDLANVLELLSIQTQKNIIASKSVSGKVTATLYGVTFYQALDSILHVNGFGYIENGNFLYVYTNEELKQIEAALKKRVSKVIRLNNLNANDAKEFVTPLLSKDGGEIKVNEKTKDFTLADKTPNGKDDFALAATLVVIDFEENIKAIEDLVRQLDTAPAQVLIEATVLQTALNEANAFGVDFSVIGDLNFTDFINNGGALAAANNLIKGGTGASGQGNSPNGSAQAATSNPGNTTGPGTLKVGTVFGNVAVFLRALDQVTDTVVLSNPKLTTLNRMPARVLVGKRVGYLNTTSTETSTTQTVNFLDTGTQLYVRPFVSEDKSIRMELRPSVSSAEIRNVTDARGAVVTIPDEVTQELTTNVRVTDGQTIVLGGLFQESATFTKRQVPWVGDIPILGAAFRGHDDATARSEIIFLVTPTILNDGHLQASAERASSDIDRVRAGSRQKLLPWSQTRMTDNLNVEAEQLAREGNSDRALWTINRSLSLNSMQPEAIRLRDRITGEKERWGDRSLLNEAVNAELNKRIDGIKPAESFPRLIPNGSLNQPKEPLNTKSNLSPGSNKTLLGNTANQDNTPIAVVNEGQQSNAQNFNSAENSQFQNHISNSSSAAASTSNDSTYHAAMQVSSSTVTAPEPAASLTLTASTFVPAQAESATAPIAAATTPAGNMSNPLEHHVEVASVAAMPSEIAHAATPNTTSHTSVASAQNVHAEPAELPHAATPATSRPAGDLLGSTLASTPAVAAPVTPVEPSAQLASLDRELANLRGQIDLFALLNNGAMPGLGMDLQNGWKPLTDSKLIEKLPVNPLIVGENSSKIVIADKPEDYTQKNAGWIYNPRTGQLWAAGYNPAPAQATAANSPKDLINAITPKLAAPSKSTAGAPTETPAP